jgi:hypothetical protein
MTSTTFSDSIEISQEPAVLYSMISDITRMGEWSPTTTKAWWESGSPGQVGAVFVGHNEADGESWETKSEVVVAEEDREFVFVVEGALSKWGYRCDPIEGGTRVTQSWEFLPEGMELFRKHYGDDGENQIAKRIEAAHTDIPATLAALKRVAEAAK